MRRVRRRHPTGATWLGSGLALIAVLVASVYLSLPLLIQHLLPRWLDRQGVDLQVDAVEHDILGARVVLKGVRASHAVPVLSAEEIVLGLDLSRLLSAELRLDKADLLRGEVRVERKGDGWRIAGLSLEQRHAAWARHLVRLDVADLVVRSDMPGLDGLRLESGYLERGSVAAGEPVNIQVAGQLGEGSFLANGKAWPAPDAAALSGGITLQNAPLEKLLPRLPGTELTFQRLTADGEARVELLHSRRQGIRAEVDGRLELRELHAEAAQGPLRAEGLVWTGVGELAMQAGKLSSSSFQGRAEAERWEGRGAETGLPAIPVLLEDGLWEGRIEWRSNGSPSASLSHVGDAELGRLMLAFGPAYVVDLEQVALWGLERRSGSALQLGRLQAGRVSGGKQPPDDGRLPGRQLAPGWRATGVAAGQMELDAGAVFRQRSIEAESLEWLKTPFERMARAGRARVESVQYANGRLSLQSLALHDLTLAGEDLSGGSQALRLEQALLLEVGLVPAKGLAVGESRLRGLRVAWTRDPQGESAAPVPGSPALSWLPVTLGTVRLEGANHIEVHDHSSSPPYRLVLDDVQARLAGWHSHQPTDSGRFSLDTRVGESGSLSLDGRLGPLVGAAIVALHGEAERLPLRQLPPLIRAPFTGEEEAGVMAAWFDLDASAGQWSAYADLRLSGLETTGRPVFDNGRRLLQDERGQLRVELALDRRRDSDAGPSLMTAATTRGLSRAILDHYGSLGVADEAARAALQSGRLPLAPVTFRPGSSSFDRLTGSHLEAVADRLKRRPLTRLRVCAHATREDLQRTPGPGQSQPDPTLLAQKGLALAGLRDRYVREYLGRSLSQPEQRLLPCEPAFQVAPERGPRVELSVEVAN